MDATPTAIADRIDDAHTINRESARMLPIEVITRGERRRVWTLEEKREIVAKSLGPALTPAGRWRANMRSAAVAVCWRQKILGGQTALLSRSPSSFAQLVSIPAPR